MVHSTHHCLHVNSDDLTLTCAILLSMHVHTRVIRFLSLSLPPSLSLSLSLSLLPPPPSSPLKHSPGLVHSSCWLWVTPSLTSFVLLSVSSRRVRSSWSSSSMRRGSWLALDGCLDRGTPTTTGRLTSSRKGNLILLFSFYCQRCTRHH